MPRISVIIPVYNVENFIEKCIKSILNQSYKDFEIIVVDDVSPDDSIKLAKKILVQQQQVPYKIITRAKNGGISAARNTGIEHAEGQFLLFVDSDDSIENEMIEKLIQIIDNDQSDIAICRVKQVYDNSIEFSVLDSIPPSLLNGKSALLKLFQGLFHAHLWKMLIAKSLFKKTRFPEGIIYEDALIFPYLLYDANKVSFIDDILYNYLQRNNSLTKKYDPRIEQVIDHFLSMEDDFSKLLNDNELIYLRKYIYFTFHILACHTVYFSTEYIITKPVLSKIKRNIHLNTLIRLFFKKPSKTILTLFLLKLSKKLFYRYYTTL